MKKLLTLLTAFLALHGAEAVPYLYTYTGSNYTQSETPDFPGFTLLDHLTMDLTVDNSLWGTEAFFDYPQVQIRSGPYTNGDLGSFLTDLTGNVLSWRFGGGGTKLLIVSRGFADGSGGDQAFNNGDIGPPDIPVNARSSVVYPPNSPSRWTKAASVPDTGSTLVMLGVGVLGIFVIRSIGRESRE